MSFYFGYTRVSTVKQGDGVSLEAQHDAIAAYAQKHGLTVSRWFEEKETAAKSGRPIFSQMIAALRKGEAVGLITHKIDRSARNFSDWALVGELIDSGVDVRFAHESLDMTSRGGRLTADIQAVIAADYVRNLREECLKGIEGRLKQGLFPFNAPIGYLNQGPGKAKILDPERAPFVRQAFELYATQQYSFHGLLAELQRRGFRSQSGRSITKGCFENLINNAFYHGDIFMSRTGRTYPGIHEPIISKALFDRVQILKSNRHHKKHVVHNHTYRRFLKCGLCNRSLCGEVQKGKVYMRCQTKGCPTKCIRQDRLEAGIEAQLRSLRLSDADQDRLQLRMKQWLKQRSNNSDKKAVQLQLSQNDVRMEKLTDALIDGLIDKKTFEARKARLENARCDLEKMFAGFGNSGADQKMAENFLELAKSLYLTYQMGNPTRKRQIAEMAFSNRTLSAKNLCLEPQKWLLDVDFGLSALCGPPDRDTTRTKEEIKQTLEKFDA